MSTFLARVVKSGPGLYGKGRWLGGRIFSYLRSPLWLCIFEATVWLFPPHQKLRCQRTLSMNTLEVLESFQISTERETAKTSWSWGMRSRVGWDKEVIQREGLKLAGRKRPQEASQRSMLQNLRDSLTLSHLMFCCWCVCAHGCGHMCVIMWCRGRRTASGCWPSAFYPIWGRVSCCLPRCTTS